MMGPYKYILFLYTLQSVLWGAICYVVTPQAYAANGYFVCFSGSQVFSIGWGIFALYVYAGISPRRHWFTAKSKMALMLLINLLLTGTVELIMILGYWPSERKNKIMKDDFKKLTGFDIEQTPYIGAPIWVGYMIDWNGVVCSAFFAVYATAAGSIIGVIIFRMIQIFRNLLKQITLRRIEYQSRIFLLLLVQTFFPMIFNFGPAIVIHFGAILRWDFGEGIITFCSFISLAQCIDPIATFLFLKEYRETVFGYFKKKTTKIQASAVSETTKDMPQRAPLSFS